MAIVRFSNPPESFIANRGAAALVDALADLLGRDDVGAIILTGSDDKSFIRHADVRQIATSLRRVEQGEVQPEAFGKSAFSALGALLDEARKPVIAAITGPCMGGGFEIALACTMRIASAGVSAIGLPEIRLDLFPGGGGTQRLSRLVGRHRARLMMLTGEVLSAGEALAAGVVDEICADALCRARELADQFSGRAPAAIDAIMRLTATDEDRCRLAEEGRSFGALGLERDGLPERLLRFAESGAGLETLG